MHGVDLSRPILAKWLSKQHAGAATSERSSCYSTATSFAKLSATTPLERDRLACLCHPTFSFSKGSVYHANALTFARFADSDGDLWYSSTTSTAAKRSAIEAEKEALKRLSLIHSKPRQWPWITVIALKNAASTATNAETSATLANATTLVSDTTARAVASVNAPLHRSSPLQTHRVGVGVVVACSGI